MSIFVHPTSTAAYHPVAIAIPSGVTASDDDECENVVVGKIELSSSSPEVVADDEEAGRLIVDTLHHSYPTDNETRDWADTYFDESSPGREALDDDGDDEIVKVFDYDKETILTQDGQRDKSLARMFFLLILLSALLLGVNEYYLPFFIALIVVCGICFAAFLPHVRKLRDEYVATLHLALTRKGVLHIHERHKTWWGRAGNRRAFIEYKRIRTSVVMEATGDCVCGFEDLVHRNILFRFPSNLWEDITGRVFGLDRILFDQRGIRHAQLFHKSVMKLAADAYHKDNGIPLAKHRKE